MPGIKAVHLGWDLAAQERKAPNHLPDYKQVLPYKRRPVAFYEADGSALDGVTFFLKSLPYISQEIK